MVYFKFPILYRSFFLDMTSQDLRLGLFHVFWSECVADLID